MTKVKSAFLHKANYATEASIISEDCEDANSNPRCPYVMQMKRQEEDIGIIKTALVGADLQGGLVKRMSDVESVLKNLPKAPTKKRRGSPKEWGALLAGLAALLTALAAYWSSIAG